MIADLSTISLERRAKRAALLNYFSLFSSFSTLICCALPSVLVLLGMGTAVASLLSAAPWLNPLASYRFLLPIGFVCLGSYYVMVAAATWLGAFQQIARTRISQGLSGPISQIGLGLLGAGAPGLAIGFVIGQSSGTFLLLSRVYRDVPDLRGTLRRISTGPAVPQLPNLSDYAKAATVPVGARIGRDPT